VTWKRDIRRASHVGATQLQLGLMPSWTLLQQPLRLHATVDIMQKALTPRHCLSCIVFHCTTAVRETFRATALTVVEVWQGGKGRYLCWLGLGITRAAVEQMQHSLLDALGLVKATQRLCPGKQHIWHACRVLPSVCLWHKLLALAIHCLYTTITTSA